MYIAPEQKKIFLAFLVSLVVFTYIFIAQQNFEFIGYIAVIVVLLLFGYMIWMVKDGSVSMVIDKPDERCGSEYIYDSALGAC